MVNCYLSTSKELETDTVGILRVSVIEANVFLEGNFVKIMLTNLSFVEGLNSEMQLQNSAAQ